MPANDNKSNSTVQGLNLVYPPTEDSLSSNSRDLLAPPSDYPDFTAQLDLWTNLSFASDEPAFIDDSSRDSLDFRNSSVPQLNMDKHPQSLLITDPDKLSSSLHLDAPSTTTTTTLVPSPNFDISSFLAGFGIDPFLVPPHPSSPRFSSNPIANISHTEAETQRANKRPRGRKSSVASANAPIPPRPTSSPSVATAPSVSGDAGSPPDTGSTSVSRGRAASEVSEDPGVATLSATEDKRRRNTAASARFRAKKKEREQAMEKRSKELESRVNELERECEGLRRENGWLKGLVVGVTSGNPVPIPNATDESSSSLSPPTTNATLPQESVKKRKRESLNE